MVTVLDRTKVVGSSWSLTASNLADSGHSFTTRYTTGNIGAASDVHAVTVDTKAPDASPVASTARKQRSSTTAPLRICNLTTMARASYGGKDHSFRHPGDDPRQRFRHCGLACPEANWGLMCSQSEGSPTKGAESPPALRTRPWRRPFEPDPGHAGEGTGKAYCPNASAPDAREPDDEQADVHQGCSTAQSDDRAVCR